jgi:hypothetical protein
MCGYRDNLQSILLNSEQGVGCDITRVTYYDHLKVDVDYKSHFPYSGSTPENFWNSNIRRDDSALRERKGE